jgi:outer membrane receptor protein involved in Fe transport
MDLNYKQLATFSTTQRYDAYSTLPLGANGVYAPSFSGGFTFSELMHKKDILNYGKIRASWAHTSGSSVPFQGQILYGFGTPINGIQTGSYSGQLPNFNLKPFTVTELEFGANLKFLENRIDLDVAWFNKVSHNENFPAQYSQTTGYTSGLVSSGSMQNRGLEVQLTVTPFKGRKMNWISSANFTTLRNKVLQTDNIGTPVVLGLGRFSQGNAATEYVVGMSGPQIMAYDYVRNDAGQIVVDNNGNPIKGDLTPFGTVVPKIYGGWNNQFSYKRFNLSFLIDYNFGNKIQSTSEGYFIQRGIDKMTLVGREEGVIVGVHEDGTPNTTAVQARDYYNQLPTVISGLTVVNGDFIKFRQVVLGYSFGEKLIFSDIQLSFVARNLAVLMKKSRNIDPESSFNGAGITFMGFEGLNLPSTRTYGVNVNFRFKK